MSEYFDENFVRNSVLFERKFVDDFNNILIKKHKLMYFEHNWCQREYIKNESPRYLFMIALFNAYFIFHESAPMLTVPFNVFWQKNIICSIKHINDLRNLFAHNCINTNRGLETLKWFVKDIDDRLPAKLIRAYNNKCKHFLLELPETNEFWGRALEEICKKSSDTLNNCKIAIENKNNIEKSYIKSYKKYMLAYFDRNYRKDFKDNEDKLKKCTDKIDWIMNEDFFADWKRDDIYPETICEEIMNTT